MTLLNVPFQEKEVFERQHSFLHMSRNFPFLFVPCQILLRQCPETGFRRPKRVFLRPKDAFKRPHRMKIHSVPFLESSSLKTRFSIKHAQILDPKQKHRKTYLETQGIYIQYVTFNFIVTVFFECKHRTLSRARMETFVSASSTLPGLPLQMQALKHRARRQQRCEQTPLRGLNTNLGLSVFFCCFAIMY